MTTEQWFYRIEGNNNVIFTNLNSSRILRLPKIRKRNRLSDPTKTDVTREVEFLEHVASKIFKDVHVHLVIGEKIYLSKDFLERLSKEMAGKRPKKYEDEELDGSTEYGLLLPNFCKLLMRKSSIINHFSFFSTKLSTIPTISIELRPKSCYFPDFETDTCSQIKDKCFFCLRKMYENMKHPDTLQTKYCPNDLYSGSPARTKRAIRDLISCPQRYFSVRIDDQDVFSHALLQKKSSENKCPGLRKKCNRSMFHQTVSSLFGENGREAFLNVLCNALQTSVVTKRKDLMNFKQQDLPPPKPHCRRKSLAEDVDVADNNSQARNNSSVLGLLGSIHSLRYLPLRKLVELHGKVKSHLEAHGEDAEALSLAPPYDAQSWESATKISRRTNDVVTEPRHKAERHSNVIEAAEKLRQFMIGRSFGCCSLIITLQQIEAGDGSSRPFEKNDAALVSDGFGRTFLSSISIIDLYKDFLPAQVEKSYRREVEMITFLNNHFSNGGLCTSAK